MLVDGDGGVFLVVGPVLVGEKESLKWGVIVGSSSGGRGLVALDDGLDVLDELLATLFLHQRNDLGLFL